MQGGGRRRCGHRQLTALSAGGTRLAPTESEDETNAADACEDKSEGGGI